MCKGFPQAVSYRVVNGANNCWRYVRLSKLPITAAAATTTTTTAVVVTDSTADVFYDGGDTQVASTVRPEEEEKSGGENFFVRAPPAILLWGLLTLVSLGGSIYAGRWLMPHVNHGSVLMRNFCLRWRDGYLAAAGSVGTPPGEGSLPMRDGAAVAAAASTTDGVENVNLALA